MLRHKQLTSSIILLLIIVVHLLFLTHIAFWPYQEFRVYPFLTSQGYIPYKELIDQHFPGIFFFPINLYTLGLATPVGLRFLQLFIVAITHIFIYLILKRITKSSYLSLFGNILFLFSQPLYEGYVLWVDSFTTPLLLISFYLLLTSENKANTLSGKNLFFSGFLLALSILFKQTLFIIFIILIGYLVFRKIQYKKISYFFLGFAIPLVYLASYIQQLGIWKAFLYWNFTFNEIIYPTYFFRLPTSKEAFFLLALVVPFILCSVYLLKKKNKYILILLAYAIPVLILLYGTWAFVHLQPFLPFAIIAISLFFFTWNKKRALLACFYIIFMFVIMMVHVRNVGNSNTFVDSQYRELIQTMKQLHADGKSVYLDNVHPEFYQLSGTVPANKFFVPNYPWYTILLNDKLLESIKKSKPDIIIMPVIQEKSKLTNYITSTYKKISVVDNTVIWEKK